MKKLLALLFLSAPVMAAPCLHSAHDHVVFNVGISSYLAPGGFTMGASTESWVQVPYYSSGTASALYAYLLTNSVTAVSTITLRINGVNTAMTCSWAASTAGACTDNTHTATINYGDKVDFLLQVGNSGTSLQLNAEVFLFTPTDTTKTVMKAVDDNGNGPTFNNNGFTYFYEYPFNMMGNGGPQWVEQTQSSADYVMKTAQTFQNMGVYITSNTKTSFSFPIYFTKNDSTTTLQVTIPANTTGYFSDLTDQVSVVAGDKVQWKIGRNDGGGDGQNIFASFFSVEMISTAGQTEYTATNLNKNDGFGATEYTTVLGPLGFDSTYTTYQIPMASSGTLSHLRWYSAINTLNGNTVVTLLKNGSAGNNSVTFGAGVTGITEDSTDVDTLGVNDAVAYKVDTTGSSSGQMTDIYLSAIWTPTVAAAGPSGQINVSELPHPVIFHLQ